MNGKIIIKPLRSLALALAALAVLAAPSFSAPFNLVAEESVATMPDGTVIPMWGYFKDTGQVCNSAPPPAWTIGPQINVPPGDTTLTVNLRNCLDSAATSLVISGQNLPVDGLGAPLPPTTMTDAQSRVRVTSFTQDTAAGGGTMTYAWNNLKEGTYLYHSGTHAALQQPMGLYGTVRVEQTTGQAYGKAYQRELILLYSEIDPAQHTPPAAAKPLNYKPKYFLVNGQPFTTGSLPAGSVNETILLRLLNAGLKTHVPTLLNNYMQLIAEDGNAYTYPKDQYSMLLSAGKTMDALFTPTAAGAYPLFDRGLHLTSAGATGGGMLTILEIALNQPPNVINPGAQFSAVNDAVSLFITATDPDLPLSFGATGLPAGLTINTSTGEISGTITAAQAATLVTVTVTDSGAPPAATSVNFDWTVNALPAAPILYFSTAGNFAVPNVAGPYDDADIYSWNGANFVRVFDGSVAGLPANANIDALRVVDADTFYMSFNNPVNPPGPLGTVQNEDIVLYDAGVWSLYFHGSDVGVSSVNNSENVDAFDILADGSVVISTQGNGNVPGVGGFANEDLVRCVGTFGPATTCTWSLYFDGSDVALTAGSEDVDGMSVSPGGIFLSTTGNFNTGSGNIGQGVDVFTCNAPTTGPNSACGSFSMFFDGSAHGVTNNLDAIDVK